VSTRRRWLVRPRPDDALTRTSGDARDSLHVEVTLAGTVVIAIPTGGVVFSPADVSRLRKVLGDAQAAALTLRGRW